MKNIIYEIFSKLLYNYILLILIYSSLNEIITS